MTTETQDHFLSKLIRPVSPAAECDEPEIWIRELRILDSLSPVVERRRVTLHRGFNILWAAPEDPEMEQGLYRDGLAGHASGKTLFCRILRHLLGEDPFGTKAQRDGIAAHFNTLWAVAHVRVRRESWIVGRPLAAAGERFAVQSADIDAVLAAGSPSGGFETYLAQVRAIAECIEAMYPDHGWRNLLPWLARDQEARFSSLGSWREASSEGDNPQTRVIDRHQIMRTVLGVIDQKEPALRQRLDHLQGQVERDRTSHASGDIELSSLVRNATERAIELLGAEAPTDPSFTQARLESLAEVMREAITRLEQRPTAPSVVDAQRRLTDAERAVERAETELREINQQLPGMRDRKQSNLHILGNFRTGNVEDPTREDAGFCPRTIQAAIQRGCVVPGQASPESVTTIAELEALAKQDDEAISRLEARARTLDQVLEQLRAAVERETTNRDKVQREANRDVTDLMRRAARVEQVSRLYEDLAKKRTRHERATTDLTNLEKLIEETKTALTSARRDMDERVIELSTVFADIIHAVMGASVEASIAVTSEGVVPHVTRKGELSGAALDTIKVLAFDLAAVLFSIEGHGNHPRFLIHDGPREGDMARVIYDRFFLYAVGIEAAFPSRDDSSFQYIITTTTPPPNSMREGSRWLLDPVLDSRTKGRRLLKEDF